LTDKNSNYRIDSNGYRKEIKRLNYDFGVYNIPANICNVESFISMNIVQSVVFSEKEFINERKHTNKR
jgi:hypothetical protein